MRIIVSNIPHDTTSEQLSGLFGMYGTASVLLGMEWEHDDDDLEYGDSSKSVVRYVDMLDVAQAYAAIKALDGWQFHGNSLKVAEAELEWDVALGVVVGIAILTGAFLVVAAIVLVATNYFLWFLHWGEVVRVSAPGSGEVVFGTRPFNGDFAWAIWLFIGVAGFAAAAGIAFFLQSLQSLWSRVLIGHRRRRYGLPAREGVGGIDFPGELIGLTILLVLLSAVVYNGCVRDEPYRSDFRLDPASRTMTIEYHLLSGLSARMIGFDEVSYLQYMRGSSSSEYGVPPSVSLRLYLKSNERIDLSNGWPRYQADFAAGILEITSWRAVCTKPGGVFQDPKQTSCGWLPPP